MMETFLVIWFVSGFMGYVVHHYLDIAFSKKVPFRLSDAVMYGFFGFGLAIPAFGRLVMESPRLINRLRNW